MKRIPKLIPKVKKINLLIVASVVWFIASINVINLGLKTLNSEMSFLIAGIALTVFILFFRLIFNKMVKKHTIRILGYEADYVEIYKFFDKKSYVIMISMITAGVVIRKLNIVPYQWLGGLYLGIGSALLCASAVFLMKYKKHLNVE